MKRIAPLFSPALLLMCSSLPSLAFGDTGVSSPTTSITPGSTAIVQAQQGTLSGQTGASPAQQPSQAITANVNNSLAPTQKPVVAPEAKQIWNLQNVDIKDVIAEVSRETGTNFLVDSNVQGRVTIISSTPLNNDEVYQLFLSILSSMGYATVPDGGVVKIMPVELARQQGVPVVNSAQIDSGDQIVATVVPVINVSASDLVSILRPMMPSWANVSVYSPANSLIMTSSAGNIQKMMTLIQDLDKANTKGIEIVPLQHANATKLVTILNSLQGSGAGGGSGSTANQVTLAADDDNNSILMSGTEAGRLQMRGLIDQLDTTGANNNQGNTKVIYLHYQDAKKLAPILSKIAGSITGGKGGDDNSQAKALIAADPTTNSIILNAPPTEMMALTTIVKQLDIRPSEVLVEAIVVQVDEEVLNRLGVEWGSIGAISAGTTGENDVNNDGEVTTSPASEFLPYTGIIRTGSLSVILSALQKSGNNNLLSTPDLMVLDNEKAKIEVGQQVSVQSGSYSDTGTTSSDGSVQPFNTYNRQNVGLELDVTPHITQGGIVSMELSLENDALQTPNNPGVNPIIDTSGLTTDVLVNSGDILVLGGLMQNTELNTTNQMPWLGDIPVVGWLFKFNNNQNTKQNLMIFLRPQIVNSTADGTALTTKKYKNIRGEQLSWAYNKNQQPNSQDTLLPAWGGDVNLPSPFVGSPGVSGQPDMNGVPVTNPLPQ